MTSYQPTANWTPETLTRSLQYHLTQSVDRAVCTVTGRGGKSLGSRMRCAARPLVLAASSRALSIALQFKGKNMARRLFSNYLIFLVSSVPLQFHG